MHSDIVGEVSTCPTQLVWESRREKFMGLENVALGDRPFSNHPQIEPLIYELQCAFCAGAWLAVVMLALAMVEVYLHSNGVRNRKEWGQFLGPLGLSEKVIWLCSRRNALLHMQNERNPSIEMEQILYDRNDLYRDAKQAVAIAFKVVFIESRIPLPRSEFLNG